MKKNDKQIAFIELSLFRKICNNCSVSKTNFVECLKPHFVLVGYFLPMTRFVIITAIMTKNIIFFSK